MFSSLVLCLCLCISTESAQRGDIQLITRHPNATQIPTFDTTKQHNSTLINDIPNEDFISFTTLFSVVGVVVVVFVICLILATVPKCACAFNPIRCCGNDGTNRNTTTTTTSSSGENNTTATSVEPDLSDSDSEFSLDSYGEDVFDDFVNSCPKTNRSTLYNSQNNLGSLLCKAKGGSSMSFDIERNIGCTTDKSYGTDISAIRLNDLRNTIATQENEINSLRSEINRRKNGNSSRESDHKRGRKSAWINNRKVDIKSDRTMARNERQSRRHSSQTSQTSTDFLIPEPARPLQFETSVTNFIHMQYIKAQATPGSFDGQNETRHAHLDAGGQNETRHAHLDTGGQNETRHAHLGAGGQNETRHAHLDAHSLQLGERMRASKQLKTQGKHDRPAEYRHTIHSDTLGRTYI